MSGVNRVILVGNLGRDPETRYTASSQAVCNFTLATSKRFKDRSGEQKESTEWHRIVVWGKQAEIAQQYLHKGSMIYLEGEIQSREYTKNGQKRTSYEIVAASFRMLDRKEVTASSESGQAAEFEADDSMVPF
jgi:single-strand DNA-binding protein